MRPWIESSQTFSGEELNLLASVRQIVHQLPEVDPHPSCHVLARALSLSNPDIQVKDGYFDSLYAHSWLLTPARNIIDPYPVFMSGGPIMVLGTRAPWSSFYREGNLPSSLNRLTMEVQAQHLFTLIGQLQVQSDPR